MEHKLDWAEEKASTSLHGSHLYPVSIEQKENKTETTKFDFAFS